MTNLQFADTHNLVAFFSKPAESEGFEQIVDFLNANPIRYALTINPTIYTSCIEQFWATVKVKTINGKVQLQALVDGKKIIITEASVRRDLQLNDEEGMDCLPNATIFEELTRMGAKTTAWNKFSSILASAIICLAINQKFKFSKYIFESMVKNLENVSAQEEMGEGSENLTNPHHTPTIIQPSTSQPQKKQKPRRPKRKDTKVPQPSGPTDNVADEAVYEEMDGSVERDATTATSLDGRIADIDVDVGINLVSTHFDANTNMFGVHDLVGDEVVVETKVASKDVNLSVDEVTLAQAIVALKSAKPKADKVMLHEPEQGTITTTTAATIVTAASTRPKAKGLVIHEEEQATTPIVSSQQPSQLNF
ncbi:hypothetical protein Tco_0954310 [Tanacetum coccineum]|uniref:Xylulose kinase-1 n=1 Tax=Tanacetum coccineum TaxID=301880 RepID=A0ABQ5E2B9_9ASTR